MKSRSRTTRDIDKHITLLWQTVRFLVKSIDELKKEITILKAKLHTRKVK